MYHTVMPGSDASEHTATARLQQVWAASGPWFKAGWWFQTGHFYFIPYNCHRISLWSWWLAEYFTCFWQIPTEYVNIPQMQHFDKKILILKLEASTDNALIYINFWYSFFPQHFWPGLQTLIVIYCNSCQIFFPSFYCHLQCMWSLISIWADNLRWLRSAALHTIWFRICWFVHMPFFYSRTIRKEQINECGLYCIIMSL